LSSLAPRQQLPGVGCATADVDLVTVNHADSFEKFAKVLLRHGFTKWVDVGEGLCPKICDFWGISARLTAFREAP
jgi:hypothetical protein